MHKSQIESLARIQFSSVAQSCLILCNPMDCSTPGFLVHHQSRSLLKLMSTELVMTQNHLILSSPSPPAFNLSQHQGLFQGVSSSLQVAKILEFQFSISPSNAYSGLISFRMDWLYLLAVQGLSRVFSNTTVQKHQFFGAQLSLQSNSHIHT